MRRVRPASRSDRIIPGEIAPSTHGTGGSQSGPGRSGEENIIVPAGNSTPVNYYTDLAIPAHQSEQ
jgi:hypothetical protein